jgi:hyperosmotically inducible protein
MRYCLRFLSVIVFTCSIQLAYAANLKGIEQGLSDSVITTKITTKFTKDKHTNPFNISVTTKQGAVTLRGHVNDRDAFVSALRLAKSTKGVTSVDADALEIKQINTTFTDAYITAKVEAAVLKAKVLDDESIPLVGINATTSNGIVTLSGELKHSQSIPPLLKRALAVHGVKQVISNLRVAQATSESPDASVQKP